MHFDEVVLNPIGAPGVLKSGLDAENQVGFRPTQIEKTPVHPLVDTRVIGDRCLGDRAAGHGERIQLDLDAAEFDALVVLELARRGEERALAEPGDGVGDGVFYGSAVIRELARVNKLNRPGFVSQDDELHLLLIADGLDPTGDRDVSIGCGGKVLDQGASHGPQV